MSPKERESTVLLPDGFLALVVTYVPSLRIGLRRRGHPGSQTVVCTSISMAGGV
jgi:hypothetical protein